MNRRYSCHSDDQRMTCTTEDGAIEEYLGVLWRSDWPDFLTVTAFDPADGIDDDPWEVVEVGSVNIDVHAWVWNNAPEWLEAE